ncbi:MAG: hypothetical protein RLZZ436_2822 [Planctomycetota bacterium]
MFEQRIDQLARREYEFQTDGESGDSIQWQRPPSARRERRERTAASDNQINRINPNQAKQHAVGVVDSHPLS